MYPTRYNKVNPRQTTPRPDTIHHSSPDHTILQCHSEPYDRSRYDQIEDPPHPLTSSTMAYTVIPSPPRVRRGRGPAREASPRLSQRSPRRASYSSSSSVEEPLVMPSLPCTIREGIVIAGYITYVTLLVLMLVAGSSHPAVKRKIDLLDYFEMMATITESPEALRLQGTDPADWWIWEHVSYEDLGQWTYIIMRGSSLRRCDAMRELVRTIGSRTWNTISLYHQYWYRVAGPATWDRVIPNPELEAEAGQKACRYVAELLRRRDK